MLGGDPGGRQKQLAGDGCLCAQARLRLARSFVSTTVCAARGRRRHRVVASSSDMMDADESPAASTATAADVTTAVRERRHLLLHKKITQAEADDIKGRGNAAFKKQDYVAAIQIYSEGINDSPDDTAFYVSTNQHVLLSNRAAAHLKVAESVREHAFATPILRAAAHDAGRCVRLVPTFARGWLRLATAKPEAAIHAALDAEPFDVGPGDDASGVADAAAICEMLTQGLAAAAKAGRYVIGDFAEGDAVTCLRRRGLVQADFGQSPQELFCPQCCDIVHQPVTLSNGKTVCAPCVGKYHQRLSIPETFTRIFGLGRNVVMEAIVNVTFPNVEASAALRQKGNAAFRQKDFRDAIAHYTSALEVQASHVVLSNRSAAHLALCVAEEGTQTHEDLAMSDAMSAIDTRPGWGKGYYRKAMVEMHRLGVTTGESVSSSQGAPLPVVELITCTASLLLGILHGEDIACHKALAAVINRMFAQDPDDCEAQFRECVGDKADRKDSYVDSVRTELHRGHRGHLHDWPVKNDIQYAQQSTLPVDAEVLVSIRGELTCSICSALFCQPVTVPCGHTFCRRCATKILAHDAVMLQPAIGESVQDKLQCPLCRHDLAPWRRLLDRIPRSSPAQIAKQNLNRLDEAFVSGNEHIFSTTALEHILENRFGAEYRLDQFSQPDSVVPCDSTESILGLGTWLPLLTLPEEQHVSADQSWIMLPELTYSFTVTKPTNVLVLESVVRNEQSQFGVRRRAALHGKWGPHTLKCGTLMKILELEPLPDGAGIQVRCIGQERFRILSTGTQNGCDMAEIVTMNEERRWFEYCIERWETEFNEASTPAAVQPRLGDFKAPFWRANDIGRAAQIQLWAHELVDMLSVGRIQHPVLFRHSEDCILSISTGDIPSAQTPHHLLYWALDLLPITVLGDWEKYRLAFGDSDREGYTSCLSRWHPEVERGMATNATFYERMRDITYIFRSLIKPTSHDIGLQAIWSLAPGMKDGEPRFVGDMTAFQKELYSKNAMLVKGPLQCSGCGFYSSVVRRICDCARAGVPQGGQVGPDPLDLLRPRQPTHPLLGDLIQDGFNCIVCLQAGVESSRFKGQLLSSPLVRNAAGAEVLPDGRLVLSPSTVRTMFRTTQYPAPASAPAPAPAPAPALKALATDVATAMENSDISVMMETRTGISRGEMFDIQHNTSSNCQTLWLMERRHQILQG